MIVENLSERRKAAIIARRKFDHDEAKQLHDAGLTYGEIAKHFGVRRECVKRAVDRGAYLRFKKIAMSGTCIDCGKKGIARQSRRCKACATKAQRKNYTKLTKPKRVKPKSQPKTCAKCGKKLQSKNKTGLCETHWKYAQAASYLELPHLGQES